MGQHERSTLRIYYILLGNGRGKCWNCFQLSSRNLHRHPRQRSWMWQSAVCELRISDHLENTNVLKLRLADLEYWLGSAYTPHSVHKIVKFAPTFFWVGIPILQFLPLNHGHRFAAHFDVELRICCPSSDHFGKVETLHVNIHDVIWDIYSHYEAINFLSIELHWKIARKCKLNRFIVISGRLVE